MDLAPIITKAPQRFQSSTTATTVAIRAQEMKSSIQADLNNGNRASSHVSRMRQLSRGNGNQEVEQSQHVTLVPVHGTGVRQLSKGALGDGAAGSRYLQQSLGTQRQNVGDNSKHLQQVNNPNSDMGVFVTKQTRPSMELQQGATLRVADENDGQKQHLRTDSANSQESAAISDTPSTSSVLMMPIYDSKPKKMERASTWSALVENLFRLQQAGYTDFTAYLKFWDDAEAIPVWEESGFIKSIKNNNGLFMYFRRTRECEDRYLKKVKIYHY